MPATVTVDGQTPTVENFGLAAGEASQPYETLANPLLPPDPVYLLAEDANPSDNPGFTLYVYDVNGNFVVQSGSTTGACAPAEAGPTIPMLPSRPCGSKFTPLNDRLADFFLNHPRLKPGRSGNPTSYGPRVTRRTHQTGVQFDSRLHNRTRIPQPLSAGRTKLHGHCRAD